MSREYAFPSIAPYNIDTLAGLIQHTFYKLMEDVAGILPAQVLAYDATTAYASVQPLIMVVDTNTSQQPLSRAQIASVPVWRMGGGSFVVNVPIQTGDLGWILASDRDISLFLESLKESVPNTFRKNNFGDSFFMPHQLMQATLDPEDLNNLVIQSLNGDVKISLSQIKAKIKAPKIELVVTDGGDNPINIVGNVFVTGNIKATGTIMGGQPPPP